MSIRTSSTTRKERARTGRMTAVLMGLAMVVGFGVAIAGLAPTALADEHCEATVSDGDSIQDAVEAADMGDTICVEPGTYDEAVAVSTSLTLLSVEEHGATVGGFTLQADNVVIDGFELTNVKEEPAATAVVTSPDHSGYEIRNNHIHGNDLAIKFRTDGDTESVVEGNLFENNDVANDGVSKAINTGFNDDGASLDNAVIQDNTFVGHTEGTNSYAIQLLASDGGHNTVTIHNNTAESSIVVNGATSVEISENDVNMENDGDSTSALFLGGGVVDAEITGNTLRNADRGLGVFDVFAGANVAVSVTDNAFEGNLVHVRDQDGALDLPTVLDENTFDKLVHLNDGSEELVTVMDDAIHASIQLAEDQAASGDEIVAEAGTYTEAVSITTPGLTLSAPDGAELVLDSATAAGAPNAENVTEANQKNQLPALQLAADGVTVENLNVTRIVDAKAAADQGHTKAIGINFDRSSGGDAAITVRDADVDVIDETGDGGFFGLDNFGSAIWISNFNALSGERASIDATLEGVTATNDIRPDDDGRSGAAVGVLNHDSAEDVEVSIEDSELTSSGRGLWVADGAGVSDVTVRHSTISHNDEGLVNDGVKAVDAVENYWGSPTGPSAEDNPLPLTGASIQGDVDYRPWCVDSDCTVTASAFVGLHL